MIAGLDTFRQVTGYDIQAFLESYRTFVAEHYQNIINYYNGADRVAESFAFLENLNREVTMIEPLIDLHRNNFPTIDAWNIIDAYGDVYVALETVNNMDRWTRSSRTTQYNPEISVDRILRQGETFELVLRNDGSNEYDDAWTRVTIENYINEEDYTPSGGTLFNIRLQGAVSFNLPNIVDNPTEENIYGKDIRKDFIFQDNDLITVTGIDAVRQTVDTILRTRKGGIPEFPNDGIEDDSIGTNVNAIQYPIIFRNLLAIFRRDARFTEVSLLDLFRDEDAIFMRLEITAILKDSFITNINL